MRNGYFIAFNLVLYTMKVRVHMKAQLLRYEYKTVLYVYGGSTYPIVYTMITSLVKIPMKQQFTGEGSFATEIQIFAVCTLNYYLYTYVLTYHYTQPYHCPENSYRFLKNELQQGIMVFFVKVLCSQRHEQYFQTRRNYALFQRLF